MVASASQSIFRADSPLIDHENGYFSSATFSQWPSFGQ